MYRDWAAKLAARVQRRFDEIEARFNFDFGPEFEIAVAELLREVLPPRAGVCRGFVVAQSDDCEGDDIIVFDRQRCPTMRLLGESLALKEQVPLEGVLAYIEAKHTLYLEGDLGVGGSLAKACSQVRAVNALPARAPVSALQITPALSLHAGHFAPQPRDGYFDHRNPLYAAVYGRNLLVSQNDRRSPDMPEIEAAMNRESALGTMPSVIAAGELLAVPSFGPANELRPVLGPQGVVQHGSLIQGGSLGLAVLHLLWAIEQFELGPVPWSFMLAEAERSTKRR